MATEHTDPAWEVLSYYQLVTDQRDAMGQWGMGKAYQFGVGVQVDYEKAAAYYQLSADQEDPDGLECLADLYLEGLGVEQSTEQAIALYQLAAERGSEEAQLQLMMLGQ